ncbi:hypothetical protein IMZ48_34070 [Candidatus Bathyarchaeota archaeon]|nr:hypothetical protein [Candidatus Bathyarchaeota archaeon]
MHRRSVFPSITPSLTHIQLLDANWLCTATTDSPSKTLGLSCVEFHTLHE